jgi:hypothetical protein
MRAYSTPTRIDEENDVFQPARSHLEKVVAELQSRATAAMSHGELEELLTREGREIQRRLLQAHLELRAAREPVLSSLCGADEIERTHHRTRSRPLATVLGMVNVLRMSYGARGAPSLLPLDESLNLPKERYSHGLRRLAAVEAARGSYDQTVEAIERSTGMALPKRQVQELVIRAAVDCDAFYIDDNASTAATIDDLLVLSLDGKGLVMRYEHLRELTQQKAIEHKLQGRLSKGEKPNRKRMATVAAVYDLTPEVRFPSDVMADLRPVRDVAKQ